MFLYHPSYDVNLLSFGIDVPLQDERSHKVLDWIKSSKFKKQILDFQPRPLSQEQMQLAHTIEHVQRIQNEPSKVLMEAYELVEHSERYFPKQAVKPLNQLIYPLLYQACGTVLVGEQALQTGFAYNLGGGQHHAMSANSRGFCVVNDLVIAAQSLLKSQKVRHVWIIDLDAHKGDGTAEITQHSQEITTLSIHMAEGWPLDHGNISDPWFIPSDIEIPVYQSEQRQYLSKLEQGLVKLESYPQADLAFVVAGSDPYEKDELQSTELLQLTKEEMLERDLMVYSFLQQKNIAQAYVMAGGYGSSSHEIYIQFLASL